MAKSEKTDNTTISHLLEIHLAEFHVMHNQILERSRIQQNISRLGFILAAAVIAFIGSNWWAFLMGAGVYNARTLLFLILIPFPFYFIVFEIAYHDIMISITAGYLYHDLKNKIKAIIPAQTFWGNEEYFNKYRNQNRKGTSLIAWLGGQGLFLILSFALLVIAITYIIQHVDVMFSQKMLSLGILLIFVLSAALFILAFKDSLAGERSIRDIVVR